MGIYAGRESPIILLGRDRMSNPVDYYHAASGYNGITACGLPLPSKDGNPEHNLTWDLYRHWSVEQHSYMSHKPKCPKCLASEDLALLALADV